MDALFLPIKLSWRDAQTIWGKIAVVIFNTIIWFMTITSLYSVLMPSSEGTNCILDELHDDAYTLIILNGLIRVLNWFGVGFCFVSWRIVSHKKSK